MGIILISACRPLLSWHKVIIACRGLETCRSDFRTTIKLVGLSVFEAVCRDVIGLMPSLLKTGKENDQNSNILGIILRFLETASFPDCLRIKFPMRA